MNIKRYFPILVMLASSVIVSGCGAGQVFGPTNTPTSASTATTTPTSTRIPTATLVPGTAVTFLTEDGIQLAGSMYGSGDIAVIMAHQGTFGATQTTWQPLIPGLIDNRFTGLAFDFRGYGQSGGPGRLARLDDDIRAAAQYLRSQNYDNIVCAGACMGGTACLRAAIDGEPFIGLIILASPFDASGGLVIYEEELAQLTQPKLFITGIRIYMGLRGISTACTSSPRSPRHCLPSRRVRMEPIYSRPRCEKN